MHPRITREKRIVDKMITIYYRKNHHSKKGVLCADCEELKAYAHKTFVN
jgi:hypothetical protein